MSDGFVVASCGANCLSVAKSPLSATTFVNFLSWSSWVSEFINFSGSSFNSPQPSRKFGAVAIPNLFDTAFVRRVRYRVSKKQFHGTTAQHSRFPLRSAHRRDLRDARGDAARLFLHQSGMGESRSGFARNRKNSRRACTHH